MLELPPQPLAFRPSGTLPPARHAVWSVPQRDTQTAAAGRADQAVVEAFVLPHRGPFVVVEPGPAQLRVLQRETQGFHQVQRGPRVGAQAYDVARVRRDLRAKQNQIEHSRVSALRHRFQPARHHVLRAPVRGADRPLSGCVGLAKNHTGRWLLNRDAGAIVLKGTTLEPRLGNEPHRIAETPMGMLNAIGLQNPGVDAVVNRILPSLDFSETRFIANACGSTIEEYVEVCRRFDNSAIDAIAKGTSDGRCS